MTEPEKPVWEFDKAETREDHKENLLWLHVEFKMPIPTTGHPGLRFGIFGLGVIDAKRLIEGEPEALKALIAAAMAKLLATERAG